MENQQLVIDGAGKYRLADAEIPELRPNESLVRVTSAALCASDFGRILQNKAHSYPLVPGHEFGGVVVGDSGSLSAVYPIIPCFACFQCASEEFHLCSDYSYFGSRENGGLQ